MAVKEHQFDISAKLDLQEMKNAVIQSQKEIDTRYDFKDRFKCWRKNFNISNSK